MTSLIETMARAIAYEDLADDPQAQQITTPERMWLDPKFLAQAEAVLAAQARYSEQAGHTDLPLAARVAEALESICAPVMGPRDWIAMADAALTEEEPKK